MSIERKNEIQTFTMKLMKYKLMADIRSDIELCESEGIDYKEYLQEVKSIIDGFLNICHQK